MVQKILLPEGTNSQVMSRHNQPCVKIQHIAGSAVGKVVQQKDHSGDDNDIAHQVWDAETGVFPGEPVHRGVQFSQRNPSSVIITNQLYPHLAKKS